MLRLCFAAKGYGKRHHRISGEASWASADVRSYGQDAIAASESAVVVCDGVGSDSLSGPFAFELARAVGIGFLSQCPVKDPYVHNDRITAQTVTEAYISAKNSVRERGTEGGSTTLCAAAMLGDVLSVANLGDSGAIVLSADAAGMLSVMYRTPKGEYKPNMPHQLSFKPMRHSLLQHLTMRQVNVVEGDIMVLGSDGLFDNVDDDDIIQKVQAAYVNPALQRDPPKMCSIAANVLVQKAHAAKKKVDDISVVVARVIRRS